MEGEPTLLVGAEQSGTTLLRLMLDSHPEIAFAEEFDYAVEPITDDGRFPPISELSDHFELSRAFSTSGFKLDDTLDFPDLIEGFLRSRQRQKGALAVGATLHFGVAKALRLWPNAKLIHLVRDPRDVAPARVAEGLAGNVWHALDPWTRTEDEWASIEDQLDPAKVLTVQFSDLIGDYDSTLTTICRFIGVEYTSQMLDYAEDTDYQEPNASVAGDWRTSLSSNQVRLIETRVGDRLARLGFEPSGLQATEVGDRQQQWLMWEDRFGRVLRRVNHFGVRLTMADLMARKLGNDRHRRSVQLKLNETEKALRKKSWSETAKYRTSR